ncbi:MCM2/3/5 family-domain-containing protein [Apiospora arundinis]
MVQVLRTVYTPESDDLFPSAIAKLECWVREHHLHINRFPMFGEKGRAKHKSDGSLNDELARRFRVDLVQDENRLNLPRLSGASQDDIRALCDVFNEFCDCLMVDEDALRSLVALPEEPPQLHVAEECLTIQAFSPPPAHHPDPEGYVRYRRGCMKAEVG